MKRGFFDGFARKMTVKQVKKNCTPQCRVGFWKDTEPFGASIFYENDAKKNVAIIESGIYDGNKESDFDIQQFKVNTKPNRGVQEENDRLEAARIRSEELL